jgi:hypothetical protein
MGEEIADIPACLVPTICPNCAYSLEGLPAGSPCPECGRERIKDEIALYGWGRGRFENVGTAKRSRVLWVALLSSFYVLFASYGAFHSPRQRWYVYLYWLPTIGVWIYAYFERRETRHPGRAQIRLTNASCVQFAHLNGPNVFMQMSARDGWLALAIVALGLLPSYLYRLVGPVSFWVWFPLTALVSAVWWGRSRSFRRELERVPDGALADANVPYRKVTPWGRVSEFSLRAAKASERWRLTITRFGGFDSEFPVDAEILCTDEQAGALRMYLERRQLGKVKPQVDPILLQKILEWKEEEKQSARDE